MRRSILPPCWLIAGMLSFSAMLRAGEASAASALWWPQFRGPGGLAVSDGQPPTHFGPGSNVVWSAEVGAGHSSPCLWESNLFVTAFRDGALETVCLDRRNGRVRWRRVAPSGPIEATHRIGSPAASTPATDGQRLIVYFGSYGLLAYGLDGSELWKVPLPAPMVEFGTGTSPVLAGDLVVLVQDQDRGSHILALERATGRQVWRTERAEFRRGFSTPLVWHHGDESELVVPGSIWLRSYDLRTGKERWSYSGTSRVANSSPTAGDGLLFSASWNIGTDPGERITLDPFPVFASRHDVNHDERLTRDEIPAGPIRERFNQLDLDKDGYATAAEWQVMADMFARAGNAVLAIRPGGHGDITETHVAWKSTRSLPYVCSPVYYQGRLYTVKNGGLASAYDAVSGNVCYQDERLDATGDYYASLMAAGGRIYGAAQNGRMVIWEAGAALNVLARTDFHEEIFATPAVIDRTLYVRTVRHLYAFAQSANRP